MKIEINKMSVSDLDLIAEKLYEEFDDLWNYNVFKSELESENSKYIVAKQNDEIIGYAGIWIAIDIAHITNIVVKKDMRRTGIGSLLLQEIINMCKELKILEITLEVNEHNEAAIALYLKCGFKIDHIRKNYYKDANAYAMIKEL